MDYDNTLDLSLISQEDRVEVLQAAGAALKVLRAVDRRRRRRRQTTQTTLRKKTASHI
jgi:hypothetical protein